MLGPDMLSGTASSQAAPRTSPARSASRGKKPERRRKSSSWVITSLRAGATRDEFQKNFRPDRVADGA
jgi:hypothetical protein